MGTEDNGNLAFQRSVMNHPSSGMPPTNPLSEKVSGLAMISASMFKPTNGLEPFFGSGWDPLVSQNEFSGPSYSLVQQNQAIASPAHLVHYPSDSGLVEMVTKLPCFGSGNFSEMASSFNLSDCGQITAARYPANYPLTKLGSTRTENNSTNGTDSREECQVSEEEPAGASHNVKRKRRASDSQSLFKPNQNSELDQLKRPYGENSELLKEEMEKKQKDEQNISANLRCNQTGKQVKENSNSGEAPKENYIHVRARRGQATNSHSLAERVRRERISERMRLLQELVPGCNKITGKAVMLDEIINYVQSLQQQVEFLSMKLATVNPELSTGIERILSKSDLQSQGTSAPIFGFGPGLSSPNLYPHGIPQAALCGIPSTTTTFHSIPQTVWDGDIQSLLQMGFDSNSNISCLAPNGCSKPEL